MKIKKGEITSQQIVMLVVLVTSFAILLFFLFRLNLGGETDNELCRNSVLLKGKSVFKDSTLLSCKTKYICLTGDGNCDSTKNLKIEKVKTENETYKFLADEMKNCWWMFGEGNVDYVGTDVTKGNYCSICSQIYLDNSLDNIDGIDNGEVDKDKLFKYMSETQIPGGKETYVEYFFGSNDLESLKKQASSKVGGKEVSFGKLPLGREFIVVMGITSEVDFWTWAGISTVAGAIVGGITVFAFGSNPIGWVVGGIVAITVTAVGSTGGKAAVEQIEPEILALEINGKAVDNKFFAPTILDPEGSTKYKILNCEEIITLS